jgi:hypothetical protein
LAIDEEATNFGFSGSCHDMAQFAADGVNRFIVGWWGGRRFGGVTGGGAEVVILSHMAACLG